MRIEGNLAPRTLLSTEYVELRQNSAAKGSRSPSDVRFVASKNANPVLDPLADAQHRPSLCPVGKT